MAGYRAALLNFTKGEISPEVRARFDLSAYQAAAERAYNVKIKRTGGLCKRAGTRFVVEALSSSAHPIPFQFSDDQAYLLEMAQQLMRPLALGGAVLQDGLTVTAITQEAQAVITAAYHGYVVGQQVVLADTTMIEINDRFLTVIEVIDANNFRVSFDSRTASPFTGDGSGGITRTAPPAAPTPPPSTPTPTPAPTPPPVTSGGSGSYVGGTYRGGVGGSTRSLD